jgi:hypothetical protein
MEGATVNLRQPSRTPTEITVRSSGRANHGIVFKEKLQMFARNAYFRMKSLTMAADFARTLENEILPLLRKQEGFRGEITFSNPGSLEQIAISLWDNRGFAEAYDVGVYPQVLKILAKVIDGTPKIRTYEAVTLSLDQGKN